MSRKSICYYFTEYKVGKTVGYQSPEGRADAKQADPGRGHDEGYYRGAASSETAV
jgi:hypothetical protein